MIDFFSELKTIGLTALFNPTFLVLLIILFFAGKLFSRLTVRLNIWKLLAIAYISLFLFAPVRDAGPIIGGVFLLGVFSGQIARLPSIFLWAQGFGDVYFAYRYRNAYEDVRMREQDMDDRDRDQGAKNPRESSQQQQWRSESHSRSNSSSRSKFDDQGGRGSEEQNRREFSRIAGRAESTQDNSSIKNRHLQTLGLKPNKSYSMGTIKKAYRRRVIETHPDTGGSAQELREVMNAWEWLRAVY